MEEVKHKKECEWEKAKCEYYNTHHYCPHQEHECNCKDLPSNEVKIFNYPWHIAHQYELLRIPNTKFTWLTQHRRGYSGFPRGDFFEELGGVYAPHYEEGKYDFALLHLDQQCFEEGIMDRGKGSLFMQVDSVIKDIPKVCLMHGTPFYPESFTSDITKDNYKEKGYTEDQIGMSSELIEKYQETVKGFDALIFNSYKAKKQWGMENDERAVTIWHGMDENEWFDLPKEPRVVTMISPAGLDKYYDRTFLRGVKELLAEKDIEHCHITVDASFKSWTEYRNFLGRSLIYFNPTKESCMPRSRAEAMFSGCCVLTTPHQDADMFIKSGENGIIVPRSPKIVADLIEGLIFDYKEAIKIGQAGKKTAIKEFSLDKFHREWGKVIKKITNKDIYE